MSLTSVVFTHNRRVYTKVYDIGTHAIRDQLDALGVEWTSGKRNDGLYRDKDFRTWRVTVVSQTPTHKNVKTPDFFTFTE